MAETVIAAHSAIETHLLRCGYRCGYRRGDRCGTKSGAGYMALQSSSELTYCDLSCCWIGTAPCPP